MMCEKVYQSVRCCELPESLTVPCHHLDRPAFADRRASHGEQDHGDQRAMSRDREADVKPHAMAFRSGIERDSGRHPILPHTCGRD